MASIEQIRDAIKLTLEARIAGLFVYDTVPSVTLLPAVVALPRAGDFEASMGPGVDDTYGFDLHVLCSAAVDELGQDDLDALVSGAGPRSIRQVVYESRDHRSDILGLRNCKGRVTGWSRYAKGFESAGIEHIGAVVRLEVITSALL